MQTKHKSRYLSAGLILLAALAFAPSQAATQGVTRILSNYSGSVTCPHHSLVNAQSVADIQQAVREARSTGKNIRVISLAAPRSYSPVICPEENGVILNVKAFNRLLAVDYDAMTARVEPGILISDLQSQLGPQGVNFPVTPDYTGVSIAGSMATGAHHSSLRIPTAVADWVEEMKIVDGQGDIRVLKGEELDTARVHLGLLGVIFELTLRLEPQSKLQYSFEKRSDRSFAAEIAGLVEQHDYARVNWFPNQQTYIVDYFDKVPLWTPGSSSNNAWAAVPELGPLSALPAKIINSSQTLQCTVEGLRVATWTPTYTAKDSSKKAPVGFFQDMIGGTCPEGKCAWDRGIKTRTVEVGFALDHLQDWTQDVRAILDARKGCFPILGLYIRFSKASKAALGQAAGRDTVMFEIHLPVSDEPVLEPSSAVYDEIVQMTLSKYQGRPHWGKNSLPYFLKLGPEQFPKWEAFRSLRQSVDPEGVFKSPFWSQIEASATIQPSPDCGVSRQCICQSDSDCGPEARCEAGGVFEELRVCRK